MQRRLQKFRVGRHRHGALVERDGQAAFGNVEHALRGAPIVAGIVQYPLSYAVGFDALGIIGVLVQWQGQFPGQSALVQNEGFTRQADGFLDAVALQVGTQKVLDAAVGRATVVSQQSPVLRVVFQQAVGDGQEVVAFVQVAAVPHRRELQADMIEAQLARVDPAALRACVDRGLFHGQTPVCRGAAAPLAV